MKFVSFKCGGFAYSTQHEVGGESVMVPMMGQSVGFLATQNH